MSTFIPMVSSSPPPLDDSADDDEFGGFASVPAPATTKEDKFGDFAAFSNVIKDTVNDGQLSLKPVAEAGMSDGDLVDDDGFDDFAKFEPPETTGFNSASSTPLSVEPTPTFTEVDCKKSEMQSEPCSQTDSSEILELNPEANQKVKEKPKNLNVTSCDNSSQAGTDQADINSDAEHQHGHCPEESPLSEDCAESKAKSDGRPQKPDSQDNTSQGSMTDSGLCSDISPVPKFEDYPEFAEARTSSGDITELPEEPAQRSPGTGEGHCKDSDSGHGVEGTELTLPVGTESPPNEDAEETDISPNEETLVTGSVSECQLSDSALPDNDYSVSDSDVKSECGFVKVDPEPLQFKTPSFSQDELEDMADELDDSFGQFPLQACVASESDDDAFVGRDISKEAKSSNEASSVEEIAGKNYRAKPLENPGGSDDDFGDFDTFQDHMTSGVDSRDNDTFAEFQGSKATDGSTEQWAAFGSDNTPTNEDDGGWASFQEPTVPTPDDDDDDDDDDEFGDFGNASSPAAPGQDLLPPGKKLEQALSICFPRKSADQEASESLAVDVLRESISMNIIRVQEVADSPRRGLPGHENKPKSREVDINVWNNLKDLDKTSALAFQWNKSRNSQRLLQSLAIDTRNILMGHKRQSLPIFAPQLGLLEPTRGPVKKEVLPAKPSRMDLISTAAPLPGNTPQDIPPAEFDWSRSGLTNPLDASSSMQLDLDFFVKNTTASYSSHARRSEVLKKEQEILQAIEPGPAEPPKQLEPLENVLASMKFTPTAPPTKDDNVQLTSEAQQVLQILRDFSFMQATVLMFPYKDFGD